MADWFSQVSVTAPSEWAIAAIICAALLLLLSAFVSASERAFFSLTPADISSIAEEKQAADVRVSRLLEDKERLLATLLLVNSLSNVSIILLCHFFFTDVFHFASVFWQGFVLTLFLSVLILLFGEIMPKMFSTRHPLSFCRHAASGLDACRALVDSVCAQLASSGGCAGGKEAANIRTFAAMDGQSLRLLGPGAVCRLSVRLRADDLEQALRSTVLRMAFDGRETVWVPVGDFFGTGNRLKPYGTYFTSVSADTVLTCRWVMPYREDCRIALENVRGDRVQASLEADVCPWQWDDRSMYFGAGWTEYNRLYTGATRDMEGTLAQRDVNFVSLRGRGVYVGDALTVFNTVADWWGEGDEKVYVDGESFPSHFGTGTEDYYGYAWCMYPPFAQPFIAQPDGSGDTQPGHVANLRFRSLDAIPFGSSLVFDMELWHWASTYVNYAPTTFWYMLPGGTSNRGEAAREAALPVARHKHDLLPCTPDSAGTVEGEFMDIRLTGGEERSQSMAHMGWSNGAQFFWRGGVPGDTARLGFRVERGGWYDLTVCATQAPDYGCFAVSLDGAEQTVDLYAPTLGTCRWSLGRVRLQPGMNWLVFRQLPKNPASTNNLLGIDRIVVRKTPRPM